MNSKFKGMGGFSFVFSVVSEITRNVERVNYT